MRAAGGRAAGALSSDLPVILIEVILVFGGVLAFGWWQLRDLEREREATRRRREQEQRPPDHGE